ncbi:MAG: exonuclease SbcCD subunit D [Eubacteriales bacterium]|nr:exonuclease SbcCD subunit D [Eubacteriales bacterium]
MKLVHLSDLHLGKRVNGFSMLEDQAYMLLEIKRILQAEQPDAVLIAGDVFDKATPGTEAVTLFDDFLVGLSSLGQRVFIVSGNHDSPERVAYLGRLLEAARVHLSPVYNGQVTPVCLTDAYGPVRLYLLPFLKPAHVRRYFPEAQIETYTQAMQTVVNAMQPDTSVRNVLVTHQFVTGAVRSDSEEPSVGGSEGVDAAVFAPFDYTALGHLHSAQTVGCDTVRYSGAPLAYSFGEAAQEKSVTVIELKEKGSVQVRTVTLTPRHAFTTVRGKYEELMAKSFYAHTTYPQDYMRIILTDEKEILYAADKLRAVYQNLMQLEYDNMRTRAGGAVGMAEHAAERSPLELFCQLYEKQNNVPMTAEQQAYTAALIESVWKGDAPCAR